MNKNKILIIVALIAIILLSGCVGEKPKVDVNDGLQFNEFSSDFTEMYDDEGTNIYVEVQNVGGTTASGVRARLYGISAWTVTGNNPKNLPDLDPPVLETSIPGEFAQYTWSIDPPELPQGLSGTFRVSGRVRYDYSTSSSSLIKVISKTQLDLLRRMGKLEEVPVETTNSYGPIKISVDIFSPITVDENPTEKMMTIYIRNVGSGLPFDYAKEWPTIDDIGKVNLKITPMGGVTIKDCSGIASGVVTLRRGYETAKIACTLSIPLSLVAGVPEETVTLTMKANYGYYIDKSVDIKVLSSK